MDEHGESATLSPEAPLRSTSPLLRETGEHKDPLATYIGSEYLEMLRAQEQAGKVPAVLFTDIDNTFFRKDRADVSQQLYRELEEQNYPVVPVTGNDLGRVTARIVSGELPHFPVLCCDTGNEIYVRQQVNGNPTYVKDSDYEELLTSKGYDRYAFSQRGQSIIEELRTNTSNQWDLEFQHPNEEEQFRETQDLTLPEIQRFKMSFNALANSSESLANLRAYLESQFSGQKVVICEDVVHNDTLPTNDPNKKYCIDIVAATKADAIAYIAEKTNVGIRIIAGDSGNDVEMLTGEGEVAIEVGGRKPELAAAIDKTIQPSEESRHFQRTRDENGNITKLTYREKALQLGPESIRRAIRKLQLVQRLHPMVQQQKEHTPSSLSYSPKPISQT